MDKIPTKQWDTPKKQNTVTSAHLTFIYIYMYVSVCALSGSTQSVNKVESELTTLAFRRLRDVASYLPLLNVSLSERRHNHYSSTPQSDTNETTQKTSTA